VATSASAPAEDGNESNRLIERLPHKSCMANIDEEVIYPPLTGWDAIKLKIHLVLGAATVASFPALMVICVVATIGREKTRFSMELAAFEGLNVSTHTTVASPAFTLKMRASRAPAPCSRGAPMAGRQWSPTPASPSRGASYRASACGEARRRRRSSL
jgi:hypothetical protein